MKDPGRQVWAVPTITVPEIVMDECVDAQGLSD